MAKTKTPEEIKEEFRRKGKTFNDWARKHGFEPIHVIRVLNGYDKGNWGRAHEIAQKLGLKAAA